MNNYELCHRFVHNEDVNAEKTCGNMSYEGLRLYSYDWFLMAVKFLDTRYVLVESETYSRTTASKHFPAFQQAASHKNQIKVSFRPEFYGEYRGRPNLPDSNVIKDKEWQEVICTSIAPQLLDDVYELIEKQKRAKTSFCFSNDKCEEVTSFLTEVLNDNALVSYKDSSLDKNSVLNLLKNLKKEADKVEESHYKKREEFLKKKNERSLEKSKKDIELFKSGKKRYLTRDTGGLTFLRLDKIENDKAYISTSKGIKLDVKLDLLDKIVSSNEFELDTSSGKFTVKVNENGTFVSGCHTVEKKEVEWLLDETKKTVNSLCEITGGSENV